MIATWALLFQSRKFWVGAITIAAIAAAVTLVALGKIEAASLVPTITAITVLGTATIGSIAWEDTTKAKANGVTNSNQALADGIANVAKSLAPPAPKAEEKAES